MKVVEEHKERRKTNKDAIMTMIAKKVGPRHRIRPPAESPVFVIDPSNQQLCSYTTITNPSISSTATQKRINIPIEALESKELDLRNDLSDCFIDICSVDVLLLFTENFDYQDLRLDFINGILTSDLLGKTIHIHVLEGDNEGYASRVTDSRSYDAISKDIISRWTYPMVLDESIPNFDRYEHHKNYKYISKNDVRISTSAIISSCSVINSKSNIGEQSLIEKSVLGHDNQIGLKSQIINSYLWNNVVVGERCSISKSIIGDNVIIEDGVIISNGCFVGEGVKLNKGVKLPPFTRVGLNRWNEDEEDEEDEDEKSQRIQILGHDSNCYLWPADKVDVQISEIDSDDEEEEDYQLCMKFSRLGFEQPPSPTLSTTSSLSTISNDASSPALSASDNSNEDVEHLTLENAGKVGASADFTNECVQSLERAFDEGHTSENASIELKTLRMASNVNLSEVRKVIVNFCLSRVVYEEGSTAQEIMKNVDNIFGRWSPLIIEMTKEDQPQTILFAQQYCSNDQHKFNIFGAVLRSFYENDIVTDDSIFSWYKLPQSRGDPGSNQRLLWEKSRRFIEALVEAESEDESEDESDDE